MTVSKIAKNASGKLMSMDFSLDRVDGPTLMIQQKFMQNVYEIIQM